MASLPPLPRHAPVPRGRGRWLAAPLAIMALRLIPAHAYSVLDRQARWTSARSTARPAAIDDSFPGSAYFLAENAFTERGSAPSLDNRHVVAIEHGPAASSLIIRGFTALDSGRALQCMTNAIYYEAGNEPEEGQRAVAQVVLNRVASGRWPASICAAIYQGSERSDRRCQFTFSCDGSMARIPAAGAWSRARRVAADALDGAVFGPAGLATFYHSLAVHPPWADRMRPVAVIGAHIFYRLAGDAGSPGAYRSHYRGREFAQPGPYAFTPPPPPGEAPATLDSRSVPSPSRSTAIHAQPVPAEPFPSAPAPAASAIEIDYPALPRSQVRAEYRNSGKILH